MAEKAAKKKKTLKQQLEEIKDELALIHAIVDTVWSELDLELVLKRIVELVRDYTGADSCLLYLYDPEKKILNLSAASASEKLSEKVSLKLGEGITGWAAANRKTVALDEKSYADYRFKHIPGLIEDTYEAFLSVPLLYRGELIGVLNVQRKQPHKHRENELKLIQSIVQQVSGAIVNARLFSELKEKAEKLEAFYEISKNLASQHYLNDFLKFVLSVLSELINSRFCSLTLYDEEKDRFLLVSMQPEIKGMQELLNSELKSSFYREVFESKKPKQIIDIGLLEGDILKRLSKMNLKSALLVPIIDRAKCVGILGVFTSYPHAFSAEEVRLVQSLANQAAVAIRASLVEDKAKKLERKLNERKLIDRAKGLLMKKFNLSEEEAYAFLRKKSMDLRKTIGEVAESLVVLEDLNEFKT